MALTIRLTRTGKKGERKFRVVVKEKRSKRDGAYIDLLGWVEKGGEQQIDLDRYKHWISQGAQPSKTVQALVK